MPPSPIANAAKPHKRNCRYYFIRSVIGYDRRGPVRVSRFDVDRFGLSDEFIPSSWRWSCIASVLGSASAAFLRITSWSPSISVPPWLLVSPAASSTCQSAWNIWTPIPLHHGVILSTPDHSFEVGSLTSRGQTHRLALFDGARLLPPDLGAVPCAARRRSPRGRRCGR